MRKTFFFFLISAVVIPAQASINIITRWETEDKSLTVRGNYGTPLGEEIRLKNQRQKAFHIFNLLRHSSSEEDIFIDLQDPEGPGLSPAAAGELSGVVLEGAEEFNPVYDGGRLFYQRWESGTLKLLSEDIVIYRSEEAFDFVGKKNETAVIRERGRLKYLSEVEWVEVDTLVGYSVSLLRWVDQDTIICRAERDTDGRRFLIVTSVRRPSAVILPVPEGNLIDAVSDTGKENIFALSRSAGVRVLYSYCFSENDWNMEEEFSGDVALLGIRGGLPYWFEPGSPEIRSAERSLPLSGQRKMELYPEGRYVWGEEGADFTKASPRRLFLLFYSPERESDFKKSGFSKVDVFEGSSGAWIFPETYTSSLQALEGEIGNAYLSLEDMRVYYDTAERSLRKIRSIGVRPTAREIYVLYILGALLAILILNEVLRKTKGMKT